MKRSAMLYCADCTAPRYKVLKQREQLPFVPSDDDLDGKWANFNLDDAFRLRLMLDLIGGESKDETQLNGLGPSYAAEIVGNAMGLFPRHPLNQVEPDDWWAGLVVFEDTTSEGEQIRFSEWYIGELANLGAWVADRRVRPCAGPNGAILTRNLPVVRIFLANVTRAANFTRERACAMGLPAGEDFSLVPV